MRLRQIALSMVAWAAANLSVPSLCLGQQGASNGTATSRPAEQNEIVATLMDGDSAARLDALKRVVSSSPTGFRGVDDALFPAIAGCADDPSPETREQAAVLIGIRWIQLLPTPMPQALLVEERLARDSDAEVRHDAVSAGLRRVKDKPDAVVDALVDAAMRPAKYDGRNHGQVIFGLQGVSKQRLISRLERYWANERADPDRAAWAYVLFLGATGEEPPDVQRLDNAGMFGVPFRSNGGYSREEINAELKSIVPSDVTREWHLEKNRGAIWGSVVVKGVAGRRRVAVALDNSRKLTCLSDVSRWSTLLTPEDLLALRQSDATASTQIAPATQETYAAAFGKLYDHLGQVYPNFQMKGIDWKAVGDALLPRAQELQTEREFGLLVEELVARLEDSHAVVLAGSEQPPEPDLPEWDPGIACLIDDRDRPVVYVVEPSSPAEKAGVKIGMAIVSVNGIPAEDAMRNWMRLISRYFGASSERVLRYDAARGFLSQDRRRSPVKLVLEDPNGKRVSVTVIADCGPRYVRRLPVARKGLRTPLMFHGRACPKISATSMSVALVKAWKPRWTRRCAIWARSMAWSSTCAATAAVVSIRKRRFAISISRPRMLPSRSVRDTWDRSRC